MAVISFSGAVWCCFISYCLYTAYTFSILLQIPSCQEKELCLKPYLEHNSKLQLVIYTTIFNTPTSENDLTLVHHDANFDYQNSLSSSSQENEEPSIVKFDVPKLVQNRNSTMFLHMFLAPDKFKFDSWQELASSSKVPHAACTLAVHHTPLPSSYSLLGEQNYSSSSSTTETSSEDQVKSDKDSINKLESVKPIIHLRSVIPFSIVTDIRNLPSKRIPSDIAHRIRKQSSTHYMPILHIDQMSLRLDHLVPVTQLKGNEANFTLRFSQTSMPKLKIWIQFDAALQSLSQFGFSPKDIDEAKSIFDTNLYLLGLTFCVALLHLTFDILAFKNDINFWRGRDNLEGLSGGTVIWRAFAQTIVFLHLFEEQTSMLVLAPAGVAVFIELWKVSKAYKVRYSSTYKRSCDRKDNKKISLEDQTRELDSKAFHYLSYLLYPLCVVGAVYSLLYVPHKSWYSWIISSLVNGVYAFGFLFMLPQLFINYHLKSVAHLPWRAFMYKAFNTFIDDLFAFIITMPTSHRLACFRDDIVFLIFLYQRWLYPVDKSRLNEFGTSGDQEEKKTSKQNKNKIE